MDFKQLHYLLRVLFFAQKTFFLNYLYALASAFLITLFSSAQQPYIIQLSERDGLNAGPVFDLHMSHQGYLYLGTNAGLVRYDGTNFERIYSDFIGSSAVDDITEDHNNQLWCKSFTNKVYTLVNDSLKEVVKLKCKTTLLIYFNFLYYLPIKQRVR